MGMNKSKGPPGKKRDEKGRFVSPVNGQPVPKGKPFTKENASEMGKRSAEARNRRADLRELCRVWMETEVGTDKDGKPITGGEMMVRVAVKEVSKGNSKFWELLRDTAGFKPVDKVMVSEVEPSVIAEVESIVREAANE